MCSSGFGGARRNMNIYKIAKQLPVFPSIYRLFRSKYNAYRHKLTNSEEIFTDISDKNAWIGKESISGPGSDIAQTETISKQLPVLFSKYGIKKMIDIPCGDFNWMKHVTLDGVDYIGADILSDLIIKNTRLYERDGIHFKRLDLTRDKLPSVDLILCRDCLVHLSFNKIFRAFKNIYKSQSHYLLTTTFTERQENFNIPTGHWRPLNLQKSPFELPEPLELINEGCTENNGAYTDKSLGLWKLSDIQI